MGQQREEEWDGDALPEHREHQDVYILLAVLPMCAVEWTCARQEGQDDASDVRWTERVTIEEAFNAADDGRSLSASQEALRQFRVSDVFGLQKCEDDQGEQLDLVLSVGWKVGGETTRQLS